MKGVGPRLGERLLQKGIGSIQDLIYHLPFRYEDRRETTQISRLRPGIKAVTTGKVIAVSKSGRWRRQAFQAVIDDGTGALTLKWFHLPGNYLQQKIQKGRVVVASQTVREYGDLLEMDHPELEVLEEGEELDSLSFGRIVPIYSLPEGFSQKTFRALTNQALSLNLDQLLDFVPAELLEQRHWLDLKGALHNLHFPGMDADLHALNEHRTLAHRSLYYQEFFVLEMALALSRRGLSESPAKPISGGDAQIQKFRSLLHFQLTAAQERVLLEIEDDLARPRPMHRLLQGDVGSGKTVIALFCALRAIAGGLQAAMMAPSEVLAEQHWLNIHRGLDQMGISSALLTSGVRGPEREKVLNQARTGELSFLVGTQALIQEKVEFAKLGLAIIDEQHRFGVAERSRLKAKGKGETPHILVMTATPIPRSLAMTAFGDLDISILDQLPPGRKPVETKLLKAREVNAAWRELKKRVGQGEQAYVVYPLVEESERMELQDATQKFQELSRQVFPEYRLGLLHGRLKPEEKEAVMEKFRVCEIQILIATTVIEVGIDVANATAMVIEHAERFGLSQLHQLRGRVARSDKSAICFLVAHPPLTDPARERLKVMTETTDGFKISETDLRLRGPGEFLGTAQSGMPPFRFADLIRDLKELSAARNDAFQWIETGNINRPDLAPLRKEIRQKYGKFLHLARAG